MDNSNKILEISNSKNTNSIIISRSNNGQILLDFLGDWSYQQKIPSTEKIISALNDLAPTHVSFNSEHLTSWDSLFVTQTKKIFQFIDERKIEFDDSKLPDGVKKLIKLPEKSTYTFIQWLKCLTSIHYCKIYTPYKSDKEILKEECRKQLVLKALASPKLITWIWDIDNFSVYVDAKSNTIIEKFTITNGGGIIHNNGWSLGGGMYNNHSKPIVRDCIFTE